ncbi:shikimate dehydrogenase [Clostridium amylolyticum]|uniref:Shikimate dehydrogenase (NADP(+)) n=1 Tax=Clostridium amylolyticum TaxID=1121298 RepID=A0A1M6D1E7_9CLOT|nr:shikimate dehydrogenase [Clostridium amylolyticum]SHI67087.1 shikimate dehydrogenase [Clostridium amylolyticum]
MKTCGLLGRNIQYSLSPKIHNDYYLENNIPLKYEIFDLDFKHLDNFIMNIKNTNIVGFNVTIPYKEKIVEYVHELKYPANILKAVNTVSISQSGEMYGYNTDYFGFIKSLKDNNINLKDKRALIIGAGGAAKAVYLALKDENIRNIDILTRNIEKAKVFFPKNDIVEYYSIKSLKKYDIILNCTPLGNINLNKKPIDLIDFNDNLIVYDLNYIPEKSELLIDAESKGLITMNGMSMLVNQAIYSINIWKDQLGIM